MLISEVSRSLSLNVYAIIECGRLGNIRVLVEIEEINDLLGRRTVISGVGRAVGRLVTSESLSNLADPLTSCDGVPEIDQFFACHCLYVTTQLLQQKILLFREQPASTLDLLTRY